MSAEDFGYDPGDAYDDATTDMGREEVDRNRAIIDLMLGKRQHADDGHMACRFCWHRLDAHNNVVGCENCTCLATSGEGRPRTQKDLDRPALSEYHARTGYVPTSSERARCHHIKPLDQRKWCTRTVGHTNAHSYTFIPDDQLIPFRKDADTMAPKKLSDIENELRALESQAETLAARRAELERQKDARLALPAEPDLDAVIKFRVQHDPHGIVYTYIATRTRRNGAQWFTTSRTHPGPYTWDAILDLMQKDVGVKTGAATLEFFEFSGEGKWVR